jgi:hypothetical protein
MDQRHIPVLAAMHHVLFAPVLLDELKHSPIRGADELDLPHLRLGTESDEAVLNYCRLP